MRLVVALVLAASSGCSGEIETFYNPSDPVAEPPPASETFELANEQPQLLPFNVRMSRLASVVGVPTTDPMFDALRKNHTSLGDHDFANGQQPDRLWTASRMTLWARSLKPVCASKAMHDLYPSFPEALPKLIETAFGRAITEDDRVEYDVSDLPEAVRYQTACLAVLSAAELVVQ